MRHSTTAALAAAAVALAGALPCQTVTTRVLAATPLTATCVAGPSTDQASQPAGPLPASGFITAAVGGAPPQSLASSQIGWDRLDEAWQSQAVLRHALFVDPSVQGAAAAGPNAFVVEFTSTAPTPIVLEASRFSILTPGAPWPLVGIDVGNDGSIEYPNVWANAPVMLAATTIGAVPLQVRVVFTSQLPGSGSSFSTVAITARPDNALHSVRNVLQCSTAFMTDPVPVFAGRGVALGGDPHVYVVGMTTQPLLLQQAPFPASVPWPCLLMPSPDIVLFAPTGLLIPLPAAVRPVQFHVQGVFVSPLGGLWTTDGYTVTAQ